MKCVCPMGGDRTCPDDCPLAVWANLSPKDRKIKRKLLAERLYQEGYSMEVIATQFGVSKMTISNDLRNCKESLQLKRRPKTEHNPKGAGRPKGSRGVKTPQLNKARNILRPKVEANERINLHKLQDQTDISHVTLETAMHAELARKEAIEEKTALDISWMKKTVKQRFDAAISAHKKQLAMEFNTAVDARVRKRIDEFILPDWRKRVEDAKLHYTRRRGFMSKEVFNTIRRALHPDSRQAISDKRLAEAFDAFMRLEKFLLDEKESPTDLSGLPDTLAQWDEMRRKATEERRARHNSKANVAVR